MMAAEVHDMSERRLPVGLLIIAPIAAGFALYAFAGQATVEDPNATATATASSTADAAMETAVAADRTAFSTPTLAPEPTPAVSPTASVRGDFRDLARVRVNAPGDCLNARSAPSLALEYVIVETCLPHGLEGLLSGEARFADGHWWWYFAPHGWVVEDYLEYAGDADLRLAQAPLLAGLGRIAFVRDGDIWLMNADGSDQRVILDRDVPATYSTEPYELHWSPDGTKIAFVAHTQTSESAFPQELHVLDVATGGVVRAGDVGGVEWSPDSRTISTISHPEGAMEGVKGVPVLVDVATGAQRPLYAGEPFWLTRPPAFNHDGTKLVLTYFRWDDATQESESAILIWDANGTELDRVPLGDDGHFFSSPKWSPIDDRLAVHVSYDDGRRGNAVYDLAQRRIVAFAAQPAYSTKLGGKCGGPDMFRMLWSLDGSTILSEFSMGDENANGVWSWNVAAGTSALAPANSASDPSPGPGEWFVFSSWGQPRSYVVAGSVNGGYPIAITDGWGAAWAP
jgi:WD40 repeat protein